MILSRRRFLSDDAIRDLQGRLLVTCAELQMAEYVVYR